MSVEIIAEAGICHLGDLTAALKMADQAKAAGADAVKYQTFLPHWLVRENDPSRLAIEAVALLFEEFKVLAIHCATIGIEFLSTPGDLESLRFLVEECGVKRLKIGSDDLTYRPLVTSAYATGLPILLSTGMATRAEIQHALPTVSIKPHNLTLLHCVSEYPCPVEHANLNVIDELKWFGWHVGYSDHTADPTVCMMAVALGINTLEIHFNPSKNYTGPDYQVGHDLNVTIPMIRDAEKILGSGIKAPTQSELELREVVRKDEEGYRRFAV